MPGAKTAQRQKISITGRLLLHLSKMYRYPSWEKFGFSLVLFGVILFSCIVTRECIFVARRCLACVDCLRRGVGSLRLQPCSEVAVRLTSLMLFHSLLCRLIVRCGLGE